jgi:large subunit ribosomal protein L19
MAKIIQQENKKEILDSIKPGMEIKVHQLIKELTNKGEEKTRVQVFEGIVLARKHGKQKNATITVRKVSNGVGVEKIFPIYSPIIAGVEIAREFKVRQAKLGYVRDAQKKLKEKKK